MAGTVCTHSKRKAFQTRLGLAPSASKDVRYHENQGAPRPRGSMPRTSYARRRAMTLPIVPPRAQTHRATNRIKSGHASNNCSPFANSHISAKPRPRGIQRVMTRQCVISPTPAWANASARRQHLTASAWHECAIPNMTQGKQLQKANLIRRCTVCDVEP